MSTKPELRPENLSSCPKCGGQSFRAVRSKGRKAAKVIAGGVFLPLALIGGKNLSECITCGARFTHFTEKKPTRDNLQATSNSSSSMSPPARTSTPKTRLPRSKYV